MQSPTSVHRLKITLVFAFFVFVSAAYFYPALSGRLLLTERDLALFFIPPRMLWVEAIKNLELPLWNPYSFSGHPLMATLQPGVFYPPNILLILLPFNAGFNLTIVLHFLMAGIFTFALLRELKAGITGSVAGGVCFMLSGYLFSAHNVISTLFTVAWVPLLVLTLLRALGRSSLKYAAAAGLVLFAMFTAGGIEVLIGTIGLAFILSLAPRVLNLNGQDMAYPTISRRIIIFAAAAAIFLMSSAIELIPFLELTRLSTRAGGLSFFEATTWSFDLKDVLQFILPDPYGYAATDERYWANQSWLKTVYLGFLPFMLTMQMLKTKKARVTLPFMLIVLSALVISMGRNTPVYHYIYSYVPFFNKLRYPVKFIFIAFFFLSVSTAVGLDSLFAGSGGAGSPEKRGVKAPLFAATVAALVFGAMVFYNAELTDFLRARGFDFPRYNHLHINLFNAKRALFFFIAYSLLICAAIKSERLKTLTQVVLMLFLTTDLFFAHRGFFMATPAEQYHRPGEALRFVSQDKGLFRVFVTPKTMYEDIMIKDPGTKTEKALKGMRIDKERISGYNIEHHVFDVSGMEVLRRVDYETLYSIIVSQKRPDETMLLSMLNAKYLVSLPEIKSKDFALKKEVPITSAGEAKASIKIYENLKYLPRFFVVRNYLKINSPSLYLKAIRDKNFNPAETALLETEPLINGRPIAAAPAVNAPEDSVDVVEYKNNSFRLKVNASGDGVLVASEGFYPGWKAYVDGKEEQVLKANLALMAVPVAGGAHDVVFEYRPFSFFLGLGVTAMTIPAIGLFVYLDKRKPYNDAPQ
ncbi:MAG: YfhO family protein [Deltaproteobacteria bacterium]